MAIILAEQWRYHTAIQVYRSLHKIPHHIYTILFIMQLK